MNVSLNGIFVGFEPSDCQPVDRVVEMGLDLLHPLICKIRHQISCWLRCPLSSKLSYRSLWNLIPFYLVLASPVIFSVIFPSFSMAGGNIPFLYIPPTPCYKVVTSSFSTTNASGLSLPISYIMIGGGGGGAGATGVALNGSISSGTFNFINGQSLDIFVGGGGGSQGTSGFGGGGGSGYYGGGAGSGSVGGGFGGGGGSSAILVNGSLIDSANGGRGSPGTGSGLNAGQGGTGSAGGAGGNTFTYEGLPGGLQFGGDFRTNNNGGTASDGGAGGGGSNGANGASNVSGTTSFTGGGGYGGGGAGYSNIGGLGASTWSASTTLNLPAAAGAGATAIGMGGNAGLVVLEYYSSFCFL